MTVPQHSSFNTCADENEHPSLLTPSAILISTFLSPNAVASFRSLPETRTVLDIIDGKISDDNANALVEANQLIKQAQDNVDRARDIFQSLPELHSATFLLDASLYSHLGQFEKALTAIIRYQHLSNQTSAVALQFTKAKLLFHSGKFTHALSEYEDMLECMEEKIERQIQNEQQSIDGERVAVIDGAAALTGVGLSKFMLHLTSQRAKDGDITIQSESIDAIQTATEMLLESRKNALSSINHTDLALDLGLAAVISLTNFGVVQRLIYNKTEQPIKRWKQGLDVLDQILRDSMISATVIPNHKYQCIQSLRARLYSNIACVLLQLDGNLKDQGELADIDEGTLKKASEMAKKALEIYDEMLIGPKIASNDAAIEEDSTEDNEENWEEIMKDNPDFLQEKDESDSNACPSKTSSLTLSPLWTAYNRAESARAIGLVAMCYYHAGAAVTSEGLLQSALDASSIYPFGQCLKIDNNGVAIKGISLSSPNLALIARDVRLEYALLCDKWDKRKGDARKFRVDASRIEDEGVLKEFGGNTAVSGLVSSLWLFGPSNFKS